MNSINIAIFGCGTVGGGVGKILLELNKTLSIRAGIEVNLAKIVELFPKSASQKFNIPLDKFCGNGSDLKKDEAVHYINEIINDKNIDLIVETIGGTSDFVHNIVVNALKAKKHVVTANKALLAERGDEIFKAAKENNVSVGYEAAVCGAIPIIKSIKESFTGDEIISISGILNGTSNYILSKMVDEGLQFDVALKLAQVNGYAEADPALDINGGDAGHKLALLIKLAYGVDVNFFDLYIEGIENIKKVDMDFAEEMGCVVKLICFAVKEENKIYAAVSPMMVKKENMLSKVNGSTNAVQLFNKYSDTHLLVGKGAGSSETASSIVADIVYIARYNSVFKDFTVKEELQILDSKKFTFPYCIIFTTENVPGITGAITTAIGNQNINIDTVSHNQHDKEQAVFSVATMPCTLDQIDKAVKEIKQKRPDILVKDPKIIPILV